MPAEAWDHARCSGTCALIILEFMIFDFEEFLLKHRQQPTIKSSTTNHFTYFEASGVLKTAPAYICNQI